MSLYTERHGMRTPIEKTYDISTKAYSLLFDCCERYFENLAWKYPEKCPDGNACCGIDNQKLSQDLEYEIPTLFRREGQIDKPRTIHSIFDGPHTDEYDQYALLDLIELIAQNARDITNRSNHSYYRHYHLVFGATNAVVMQFVEEINAIFQRTGLLYQITDNLEVERIADATVLSNEILTLIQQVNEPGLKDLLLVAVQKHKSPHPSDQRDAVEKIWDAFERMKTFYTNLDKKNSADKIIGNISGGQTEYVNLLNEEFRALTSIGNNFRIRHHETNKTDIIDQRHYDYFFNRCLALIALAIQYL